LVEINVHDLRDYTEDKHRTVDDKPYGGGPGMIMKAEPICKAVEDIKKGNKKQKTALLSAKGKKFDQKKAFDFSKLDQLILICGRYEGVDERVAKHVVDEEISIGDYILTGGELPAMVITDAVTRLIPGVIKEESLKEESFSEFKNQKEYPQYTRPESIEINGKERSVPEVLISGNHKEIEKWKSDNLKTQNSNFK
jgi:tRNA (guanine37-N1)-methyltransferase